MPRQWVVNASPIITLAKIGRVDLLPQLCHTLIIPEGVALEISQGEKDDPALHWIRNEGQSFLWATSDVNPTVATWDLGMGESHVLSWAIAHPEYEAILDDRAARKAAAILKIPIRGTLGVILLAKQAGYITSAKVELEQLVQSGFRVGTDVFLKILALAGE